jgi:hypothetical protein
MKVIEMTDSEATTQTTGKKQSDYQIVSDAIESLHQACMEQSEGGFLRTAMYHFHRVMRADYVIAGHRAYNGSPNIQTEIVLQRGIVIPNMVYELNGTPCEIVMNMQACVYPHRVADLFPGDRFFREKAIEGYVGVPILDSFGNLNGVIIALTQNPVPNPKIAVTLAKLFAVAVSPLFRPRKK